jgi:hypothetical protein
MLATGNDATATLGYAASASSLCNPT